MSLLDTLTRQTIIYNAGHYKSQQISEIFSAYGANNRGQRNNILIASGFWKVRIDLTKVVLKQKDNI